MNGRYYIDRFILVVVVHVSAISTIAQAPDYVVVPLSLPNGADGLAADINDHGMIVGWSRTLGGQPRPWMATAFTVAELQIPPGDGRSGFALGVNNGGVIVGGIDAGFRRAARWVNGSPELLDEFFDGKNSLAVAINGSGVVVGFAETSSFQAFATRWTTDRDIHHLKLPESGFGCPQEAIGINGSGAIIALQIGPGLLCGDPISYHWSSGVVTEITSLLWVNAIGEGGELVGPLGDGSAVITKSGTLLLPQLPGDDFADGLAINSDGIVVGTSANQFDGFRAVIWENGTPFDLNGRSNSDLLLRIAWSISDGGTVVGEAFRDGVTLGFAAVPAYSWDHLRLLTSCPETVCESPLLDFAELQNRFAP